MLTFATLTTAATITGTIYDYELEPVAGAIVTINTTPSQTIVAVDGTYELQAPSGTYKLDVNKKTSTSLAKTDEEVVKITDEGTYNLDFILFPQL